MRACTIDYETKSRADLKSVGAHRYAIDESTEVFMASIGWNDSDEVLLWINPKFATPDMLGDNEQAEAILASADELHAHNANFEQAITWGILQQGKPTPFKVEPPLSIWRCTAAIARKAGLPYKLETLGETLNLPIQKDKEGKALVKWFCEPDKEGNFREPRDHREKWLKFCAYCVTDNKAEKLAGKKLKAFELQGGSLASFQFDLRMNQRGIPINVTAARNAQKIINQVQAEVTTEFQKLTGLNPTQREKVRQYLVNLGVKIGDMQADTITEHLQIQSQGAADCFLDDDDDATRQSKAKAREAVRVLEMYQKLSYAAVKKIQTMLDCVCPDGRVRGGHLWYGTGPGRASGKLLQPQNFKKTPPELRPVTKQVYAQICRGASADQLDAIYGQPMELISACIRHFIHDPARPILDGDYSAIQARVICWLAGQADALKEYREGIDRYRLMGGIIYGKSLGQVTADERETGKRAILGLGFQMGTDKFQSSCKEQYGLDLPWELCEKAKLAFRQKHDKIVAFWYKLDADARSAIGRPGERFGPFMVRPIAGINYLLMQLPSGRSIAYPHPKIEWETFGGHIPTSFDAADLAKSGEGAQQRSQITYWGQLPMTTQWGRIKLYGGKLAENMTMGVEADIMSEGCIQAEQGGMEPFMLVHDQALAFPSAAQTPEQFAKALTTLPKWAAGLPIAAECKLQPYYTK